ncbi:MAG: tyrosine-type recombinase/integrase [Thiocapsa sp.]|uniref:tyrosine-type recombinase/integrase n=1 Tax=Thiocapsa sp. TaxID=2024551 RepID=UPI001BCF1FB6|nr:tyrosine-type recombinase/integrase [Thiocapsa sp.]QVL49069.1 MAG: tyrosine-type recombinase/integrase [Thiocapsa sp.]
MATAQINFTERALDAWVSNTLAGYRTDPSSIPSDGDAWIRDRGGKQSVPGLCLRIRLKKKGGTPTLDDPIIAFYLVRKIQGKKRALRIGERKVFTVELARDKTLEELRNLEQGVDQRVERKRDAARLANETAVAKGAAVTYGQVLERFLEQADLSEGTRKNYLLGVTTTFKAHVDRPLSEFTETFVRELHRERSKESPSRADHDFRVLRLLWNWARDQYRDVEGNPIFGDNPVSLALNKRRTAGATKARWNDVPRKETIIPEERLGDWFAALHALKADPTSQGVRVRACDLLEALVLTGLRLNELATLTWDLVDFQQGTIKVPAPRSKNGRPLLRPMTRRVREILEARFRERDRFTVTELESPLVFPGRTHVNPIKDLRDLHEAITTRTGLVATSHDLRRVFASAALREGVPQLVLKRLLNHLSGSRDVTAGYQISGLGDLRDASQLVENHILGKAGMLPPPDGNRPTVESGEDAETLIADLVGGLSEERRAAVLAALRGA